MALANQADAALIRLVAVALVTWTAAKVNQARYALALASYRTDAVLYSRRCISFVSRACGGGVFGHTDRSALVLSEEHSSITASSVSSIPPRWRWLWSVVHRGMQPAAHWLSVRSRAPSPPVLTSFVSRASGGGGLRSSTAPSKPVSTHLYRARITAQTTADDSGRLSLAARIE